MNMTSFEPEKFTLLDFPIENSGRCHEFITFYGAKILGIVNRKWLEAMPIRCISGSEQPFTDSRFGYFRGVDRDANKGY